MQWDWQQKTTQNIAELRYLLGRLRMGGRCPPKYTWLGSDGHLPLITIWNLLVAPPSLVAVPFQGCVADYNMSLN